MNRIAWRTAFNLLLLASVIVVALTGFLVDQLDLNDFKPHSWSGYLMAGLVAIHVGLNWKRLWVRRTPPPPGTLRSTPTPGSAPGTGVTRRTVLVSFLAAVGGIVVGWFTRAETSPAPYEGGDVGLFYHQESSLGVGSVFDAATRQGHRPDRYKDMGDQAIALPAVTDPPTMSVAQALQQRRSLRDYRERSLTPEELAWLVSAATGITRDDGRRSAPSAGALYPIETYVAIRDVKGVGAGLYHVDVREQALELVREGAVSGDVMIAGLGQDFLRAAPVVFILTGLFQRTRWKYHDRHYRYVVWEAGHIAQNLYLSAEASGLGACVVGAFLDSNLNDLLGIDGRGEAALGLIAVGPR